MQPYIVRQGDYLTKLAHTMGFDGEKVWADPKNADLKTRRPDPDQLAPGDVLFVPEPKPPELSIQKGTTNSYVVTVPKVKVKVVLKSEGQPLADEPYVIEGLGDAFEGKTGADGSVELSVPVHLRELQLVLYERNLSYPVRIGDLNPVEELSGVRMRLAHLGHYGWYPPDEVDETDDRDALLAFQAAQGIEATGVLDVATRAALRDSHGT